ncbi:hypothetical protein [Streptomyces sp. bgisy100]|uniref:hypothetical protein n=1 Tax=Streptomyces sp. bgisy100 TaxID=3413783 RepID=UPI003D72A23B
MRRIATTLGTLAAAVLLTFAVPQSAVAAWGVLTVNHISHWNPGGCYRVSGFPATVENGTDALAYVYTGTDCSGELDSVVYPGDRGLSELGNSVYVP